MSEAIKKQSEQLSESGFEWARDAMRKQKWNVAAQRWEILRKAFPEMAPVWVQGAVACRRDGQIGEAERLLHHAQENFPQNDNVLFELSEIAKHKGEFSQALHYLVDIRERRPNNPLSLIRMTEIHLLKNEVDEAIAVNKELMTRFEDRSEVWIQYAEIAMKQLNWEEALLRWKKVQKKFPEIKRGYLGAAEVAENLGNTQEAKRYRLAAEYGQQALIEEPFETTEKSGQGASSKSGLLELIWVKSTFNLKSEASRNKLSYLWWLIEPLLFMAVFYIVFAVLLDRGGENYVVNLLIGLVVFQWFAKGVQSTSGSIMGGRGLLQQVNIAPIFFPAVSITQTTLKHSLVFVMLFVLMSILGFSPNENWLFLLPVILVQFIFIVSVGLLLALLVPFIRDLQQIIPTGIQFLMFVSGIFFGSQDVPEEWREVFFLNPVANLIEQYRLVLVSGLEPSWSMLVNVLLLASTLLLIVGLFYSRNSREYAKVVSQ